MPTYVVTNPATGQKVRLTGDEPPTDEDLDEIFKSLPAPDSKERTFSSAESFGDKAISAIKTGLGNSNIASEAETAAQIGTGMFNSAMSGISAVGGGVNEFGRQLLSDQPMDKQAIFDAASKAQQETSEAIPTYSPVTEGGKATSQFVGEVMDSKWNPLNIARTLNQAVGASDKLAGAGYPGLATAVDVGGDALAGAGIGKLAKVGVEAAQARRTAPITQEAPPAQVIPEQVPESARTETVAKAFADEGMKDRISTITENVKLNPERVAAAKRLGVDAPIAALSDDIALQELGGAIAAVPGSKAGAILSKYHDDLTKTSERLIQEAGGELDKGLVSTKLKEDMADNIKLLNEQSGDIYKAIDEAVPKDTIVNTKPLLRELNSRAGKSEKGIAGLSDVEQAVYDTIKGKPTYFDIDNLRKDIGESIGGLKGTYHKSSSAPLKDMYGKLTELQEGVATQVGAGAGKLWKDAKELDKARFRLQENSEFLFGKDLTGSVTTQVEQGLKTLAKGDTKKFNEVIKSIPAEQKQRVLMSGLDSMLRKTQKGETSISPVQFNAWYGELSRSTTNKRALMKNLPEGAEQRLDDMFKLTQGLQNLTTKITRTGIVPDALKNFDKNGGLVDRLYNVADKVDKTPVVGAFAGAPVRIASSMLKMAAKTRTPAITAADDLLADPSFRTAILDYQKTGKANSANQNKLKSSANYKKYIGSQSDARKILIEKNGLVPFLINDEEEK